MCQCYNWHVTPIACTCQSYKSAGAADCYLVLQVGLGVAGINGVLPGHPKSVANFDTSLAT